MRVKLLKLELLDNPKVKVTADIQLGSLLVIHGIKLLRLDNGRMMVYMPSRPEGKEYVMLTITTSRWEPAATPAAISTSSRRKWRSAAASWSRWIKCRNRRKRNRSCFPVMARITLRRSKSGVRWSAALSAASMG